MADDQAPAEIDRLRAEVESYRQRELADLHSALATARQEAAHYRAESLRLQQLGYEIDHAHRETIAALQTQLEAARQLHVTSRRPVVDG